MADPIGSINNPVPYKDIYTAKDINGVNLWSGGANAVAKVQALLGTRLSPAQERIVDIEGYFKGYYKDSEGNTTYGVGQTGKYMTPKGFFTAFEEEKARTASKIKNFKKLPEYLKTEFIQSGYRGDIFGSPKAIELFNKGDYKKAAITFLDHNNYRAAKILKNSIYDRFNATYDAIIRYGKEQSAASINEKTAKTKISWDQVKKINQGYRNG